MLLGAAALLAASPSNLARADDRPGSAGAAGAATRPDSALSVEEIVRARGGPGGDGGSGSPSKKFRDFGEVTKGAEKINGLFTLYRKDDHLYAEIRTNQLEQPFLLPTTIARGIAQAGVALNHEDEMVLVFRRNGDRIQLVRKNIHFKAPNGSPLDKSVKQNYTDSILLSLPIETVNPAAGMAPVIDFNDIFLTDFAQFGPGPLDRSRTSWHQVKAFPNNLELEVEATFGGGRAGFRGNDGVADPRGITVVLHYSLIKAPDGAYRPRAADDRVGYFLSALKDFGSSNPDTTFVRYVNRWRLEKADPKAKLSPPKRQIVWYIEDTVPFEYRPYVESGIREWNKAFEKIGFREAIAVRWQEPGRDDFDPEDTNYCTFRWVTTDNGMAMSNLRANPLTGEMIDGDVVFHAGYVQYWKREYAMLIGTAPGKAAEGEAPRAEPLAMGEIISPILAGKLGYGQPGASGLPGLEALSHDPDRVLPEVIPSSWGGLQWQLSKRLGRGQRRDCQTSMGMQRDFSLVALALADPANPEAPATLPEEFIGQGIKDVVMHEVGHSLGLRHNFKASTMLSGDQLHDPSITRTRGLYGSVMDYSTVNLAPKGKTQGDYYTTTLGPYDYWAIEYAYKPIEGNEAEELKKIAARSAEDGLAYATDEDSYRNNDPYVNRWDIGGDPCEFVQGRIATAAELLKSLDARAVKDGESWSRARWAFGRLLGYWGDGAHLASQFIGGQSVSRHHKGDKDGKDPVLPVAGDKQRECLKFLTAEILGDKSFQFSPALLRRLGTERWSHWGSNGDGPVDYPVLQRVLDIQKIVLGHCLAGDTLSRLQNQELQADPGTNPLRIEEVFRALTEGVWSDLTLPADAPEKKLALSAIRRNLQREYLRRLSGIALGSTGRRPIGDAFLFVSFDGNGDMPADARALARLHLKQIRERLEKALGEDGLAIDDTTRAHLEDCREKIAKVLDAPLSSQGF
jgi:hypothetical protein